MKIYMFPYNRPPRRHPFFPSNFPQHGPRNSIIDHFKTKDGQLDFEKISKSIDQANKLVGQMNPIIKQVSSFIRKQF